MLRFLLLLLLLLKTLPPVAAQIVAQSAIAQPTDNPSIITPTPAVDAVSAEPAAAPQGLTLLSGRVFDADGRPLAGATATVIGTEWMAVSDGNGTFSLPVQALDAASVSGIRVRCSYQGLPDQLMDVSFGVEDVLFLMRSKTAASAPGTRATGRTRDL